VAVAAVLQPVFLGLLVVVAVAVLRVVAAAVAVAVLKDNAAVIVGLAQGLAVAVV
jgi:hypothetical protein